MKRRHSSPTREKRQPLLFCGWDPPVHGGPWAGLGESVSSPCRTKELVWRWWWERAAHDKVSMALGPRSVLPDQFLTTGTPHINQGLREARGPSDTAASCPPFTLHPQACSILLFLSQEPRHSRGCSGKPGVDSSTPMCRPPGPAPALSQILPGIQPGLPSRPPIPRLLSVMCQIPYLLLGPSP